MVNDTLVTIGKGFAGLASAIVILRVFNLKAWRRFSEPARLKGKTFLITGANSGIGKELTRKIVQSGGNVVMLCRDKVKGEAVVKELLSNPSKTMGSVTLRRMDLTSFKSIQASAQDLIESVPTINCLINNAAIMQAPFSITEDGFESHMQVNHLGHALLTTLLLPKIASSGTPHDPSRIVFVSSALYKKGTIREEDFKPGAITPNTFKRGTAYSNSKLASLLYVRELANQVKQQGYPVIVNLASPGMVYTNLGRHFNIRWYQKIGLIPFAALFLRTPNEGAQNILYVAASEKTLDFNGAYFHSLVEEPIDPKFDSTMASKVFDLTMKAINKSINQVEKEK